MQTPHSETKPGVFLLFPKKLTLGRKVFQKVAKHKLRTTYPKRKNKMSTHLQAEKNNKTQNKF